MGYLQDRIDDHSSQGRKGLILLLDPDKLEGTFFKERMEFAREFADIILLGGSLTQKELNAAQIEKIREKTGLRVVIFPANSMHINPAADGILFLSLLSGRNPDFLIGQHVTAAPFLKRSNLEVLPTSYLLIGTGRQTTAEYISHTSPIPSNKPDIAAATALAGEYQGKRMTYLDAGSGADGPVPGEMISAVRQNTSLPLIVGGGIRDSDSAEHILESGADFIVIGNLMEEDPTAGVEIGLMVKGYSLSS